MDVTSSAAHVIYESVEEPAVLDDAHLVAFDHATPGESGERMHQGLQIGVRWDGKLDLVPARPRPQDERENHRNDGDKCEEPEHRVGDSPAETRPRAGIRARTARPSP